MRSGSVRAGVVWVALGLALAVPVLASAASPLLGYRDPVYIAAGFAGVMALALLLVQPLLVAGLLPGLAGPRGRRAHRALGAGLVVLVVAHVAGLWVTSPPDVVDALLFASPTPFSVWGVLAMWAVFAAAAVAALRRRVTVWRRLHAGLTVAVVAGSVAHALLIWGSMEPVSKAALCALVVGATVWALADLARRRRGKAPL